MRLFRFWCWLRDYHQFQLPPGDPDITTVNVDTLACRTCGKDFLELVAYHNEVTREQARRTFTSAILTRE